VRKKRKLEFGLAPVAVVMCIIGGTTAQILKPPYILGKNEVRIKSRNFLAGKKPTYGSTYQIYNNRKPGGAAISFDKRTNEFEIVTGADNTASGLRFAKRELRNAETALLRITGIASNDRCRLKVLMRIVVPGTTDGGLAYQYLPSCGEF